MMFPRILCQRSTEIAAHRKKGCASTDLEAEPPENVPKELHATVLASQAPTADSLGVLGWVLAGVSVLIGFLIIAVATIVDGEATDHRRANSYIPQEANMIRSPRYPIPRYSPMAIADGVMDTEQSHNTASTPQEGALSKEKDALDGKEVRKASSSKLKGARLVKPTNPKRAD
jgi:hypothetical protein